MDPDRSSTPPFGPSNRSRWVVAALTVLLLTVPAAALATHVFSDVDDGSTHAPGIAYVADAGITQGCTSDRYCPDDALTRAQMGTFLYRSSGHDPATPPSVNAAELEGEPASAFARTDDLPEAVTVTEHVGCVGTSFLPNSSIVDYHQFNNHVRYITGPGSLFDVRCPVSLPDGARLTSASFRVGDTSPTHNVARVEVSRRELLTAAVTGLATQDDVTTNAGADGPLTVTLPIPPADAVVDNSQYGYTLDVAMGPSNAGRDEFVYVVGATLTYELDRLVP